MLLMISVGFFGNTILTDFTEVGLTAFDCTVPVVRKNIKGSSSTTDPVLIETPMGVFCMFFIPSGHGHRIISYYVFYFDALI
jgi:hypothetical protein